MAPIMRNCEYILLAEFDIDEGSTLRHEYPAPTGCDAHLLAELMLPDGAHLRSEDWTVFYLNQTKATTVKAELLQDSQQSAIDFSDSNDDLAAAAATAANNGDAQAAGPGTGSAGALSQDSEGKRTGTQDLLYVMSLVRTKQDSTYKRGALVKALAVCSRHPFIQIFKPVLLLALEDYFNEPLPTVLKRLYEAINSIDISHAPRFSPDEKIVLRNSERKDLFGEKFHFPEEASHGVGHAASGAGDGQYDASARSQTPTPANISNVAPGHGQGLGLESGIPELAIRPTSSASVLNYTDELAKPRTRVVSGSSLGRPGTSGSGSGQRQQPLPMQRSLSRSKELRDTHFFDTHVAYNGLSLPIRLPLATFQHEVGDYSLITLIQTFSHFTGTVGPVHPHLHTNGALTPPIIVLFNALITYKRVLFLGGSGQPASQVSNFVLSAAALGSCGGIFFGSDLVDRCFPYSNLTNLDNQLGVPGYIAGVSNPRFEDLTSTWDVLCNIETGRIHISKDIQQMPGTGSSFSSSSNASQLSLSTSSTTTHASTQHGGSNGPPASVSSTSVDEMTSPDAPSAVSGTMPFGREGAGIAGMKRSNSEQEMGRVPGAGGPGTGTAAGSGAGAAKIETRIDSFDNLFMDEVIQAVQAHFGESVIRARFVDYVRRFVRLASRWEEDTFGATSIDHASMPFSAGLAAAGRLGSGLVFPSGTSSDEVRRELASNTGRIEGWRRTKCYEAYKAEWMSDASARPVRGMDLHHQIMRLRSTKKMSDAEVEAVMRGLRDGVKTDEQIIELLSHLPSHFSGLLPIAFGLFHPSAAVRNHTLDLLDTLNAHPTGSKFLASLNIFHRLAYARLSAERVAARTAQQPGGHHSRQHSAQSASSGNWDRETASISTGA